MKPVGCAGGIGVAVAVGVAVFVAVAVAVGVFVAVGVGVAVLVAVGVAVGVAVFVAVAVGVGVAVWSGFLHVTPVIGIAFTAPLPALDPSTRTENAYVVVADRPETVALERFTLPKDTLTEG